MDFDIVDERMVSDGALEGIRVLVLADGTFFAPDTLSRLEGWVRAGGAMVRGNSPMMTVEGDTAMWERCSGVESEAPRGTDDLEVADREFLRYTSQLGVVADLTGASRLVPEARVLATAGGVPVVWARPLGKGWVIVCGPGPSSPELYRAVVRDTVYNLPFLDNTKAAARELAPEAAWGTLYTVLLRGGEIIAYNGGAEPVETQIGGTKTTVAPHSLVSLR
jgi:hypothetical protein